jgi:hypothetical protein
LEEEKAMLEAMVKTHEELLMEIARETWLDLMGEDAEDEEEEEDADDGGDATAPPTVVPPHSAHLAAAPEEINDEVLVEMIPEHEAPVSHEVILADAKPEMPQLHLYHALMMDYEENPLRMEDDFDDLDDDLNEVRSNVDEWFPEDGSNDRD